jgi:uncharacterized sulfatase
MHGTSFKNILSRPASSGRAGVFGHWGLRSFFTYDGEWKFQLNWTGEMDELYNLKQDPGELKNLVREPKYADVVQKRRQAVFEWLHETGHPYAAVIRKDQGVD